MAFVTRIGIVDRVLQKMNKRKQRLAQFSAPGPAFSLALKARVDRFYRHGWQTYSRQLYPITHKNFVCRLKAQECAAQFLQLL